MTHKGVEGYKKHIGRKNTYMGVSMVNYEGVGLVGFHFSPAREKNKGRMDMSFPG